MAQKGVPYFRPVNALDVNMIADLEGKSATSSVWRQKEHISSDCISNKHLKCCIDDCPCICHRDDVLILECRKRLHLGERRISQ